MTPEDLLIVARTQARVDTALAAYQVAQARLVRAIADLDNTRQDRLEAIANRNHLRQREEAA